MNNIKDIMFVDGVYTSISHIFTGLHCGIVFSYIFKLKKETLDSMSVIEIYGRLLLNYF